MARTVSSLKRTIKVGALKGWFDVKGGEASIFKPESEYQLVARVQMEDWPKLTRRHPVTGRTYGGSGSARAHARFASPNGSPQPTACTRRVAAAN